MWIRCKLGKALHLSFETKLLSTVVTARNGLTAPSSYSVPVYFSKKAVEQIRPLTY